MESTDKELNEFLDENDHHISLLEGLEKEREDLHEKSKQKYKDDDSFILGDSAKKNGIKQYISTHKQRAEMVNDLI